MASTVQLRVLTLCILAIQGVAVQARVAGPQFSGPEVQREPLPCQAHTDGFYSFTIEAEGVWGPINLLYVQQNGNRRSPFSTTALHNSMNQIVNGARRDNYRRHPCAELVDKQTNCTTTFQMTPAQSELTGLNSFDRGHLSPVISFRFSQNAVDETFYCVNVAPQEPYTNGGPWSVIEARVHTKLANTVGYVMTGVCERESIDGPTLNGWSVPECYWKLVCYRDEAGRVQVIGFIGDNALLDKDDPTAKPRRSEGTRAARHQADVLEKVWPNGHLVAEAWMNAEAYLLHNRFENRAPSAKECGAVLHAPRDVIYEWSG